MTRKKAVRGKPGPRKGFQPAVNTRRMLAKLAKLTTGTLEDITAPTDEAGYIAQVRKDPMKSAKRLRVMSHAEMRLYAKGIDIPQHNIDDLTQDKLMQNCLMKVGTILEALTGD